MQKIKRGYKMQIMDIATWMSGQGKGGFKWKYYLLKLPIAKMGLVPWKLNNTGNQIVNSGCQCHFCQWITDIIRKSTDKHFDEHLHLCFCWLKDGAYTVYHGGYDDLERFSKCDIRQFICKEEKDFPKGAVILASACATPWQSWDIVRRRLPHVLSAHHRTGCDIP